MKKTTLLALLFVTAIPTIAGCEKSAKQEGNEAVKEFKQGDVKQGIEETGEAAGKAVKEATH
jgi:hypothetical protein